MRRVFFLFLTVVFLPLSLSGKVTGDHLVVPGTIEFYDEKAVEIEDFRKGSQSLEEAVGEAGFVNWVIAGTYRLTYSEYIELIKHWKKKFGHLVEWPLISEAAYETVLNTGPFADFLKNYRQTESEKAFQNRVKVYAKVPFRLPVENHFETNKKIINESIKGILSDFRLKEDELPIFYPVWKARFGGENILIRDGKERPRVMGYGTPVVLDHARHAESSRFSSRSDLLVDHDRFSLEAVSFEWGDYLYFSYTINEFTFLNRASLSSIWWGRKKGFWGNFSIVRNTVSPHRVVLYTCPDGGTLPTALVSMESSEWGRAVDTEWNPAKPKIPFYDTAGTAEASPTTVQEFLKAFFQARVGF